MENCVICCEQDWDDCFEVQEFVSKDTYVFKVYHNITLYCANEYSEKAKETGIFIFPSHFMVDEPKNLLQGFRFQVTQCGNLSDLGHFIFYLVFKNLVRWC